MTSDDERATASESGVDPGAESSVDPGSESSVESSVDPGAESSVDPGTDTGHDPAPSAAAGEAIIGADLVGTAVFVATAVIAAVSFSTAAQWVGAITAMSLFVIGVLAFLWAFYNAVQRSRAEQVSVTQLFLLFGDVAPRRVRRVMLSLLLVQFTTALATTLARPDGPDGTPGSSLAVGILVPMFGFGLNGVWAAFHGRFEDRDDEEAVAARSTADRAEQTVRTRRRSIGKNERHG